MKIEKQDARTTEEEKETQGRNKYGCNKVDAPCIWSGNATPVN